MQRGDGHHGTHYSPYPVLIWFPGPWEMERQRIGYTQHIFNGNKWGKSKWKHSLCKGQIKVNFQKKTLKKKSSYQYKFLNSKFFWCMATLIWCVLPMPSNPEQILLLCDPFPPIPARRLSHSLLCTSKTTAHFLTFIPLRYTCDCLLSNVFE